MAELDFSQMEPVDDGAAKAALAALVDQARGAGKDPSAMDAAIAAHEQEIVEIAKSSGIDEADLRAVDVVSAEDPDDDEAPEQESVAEIADESADDEDNEPEVAADPVDASEAEPEEDPLEKDLASDDLAVASAAAAAQAMDLKQRIEAGGSELLPMTKLAVAGQGSSVMLTRLMPAAMLENLRGLVRDGGLEMGYPRDELEMFSAKLSQSQLSVAAILAAYPVDALGTADLDASTAHAVRFLARRNPVQVSLMEGMAKLVARETVRDKRLDALLAAQRETTRVVSTVEQMGAFQIADRVDNLTRGMHTSREIDVTVVESLEMRERARAQVKEKAKIETDRKGRNR